MPDITAGGIGAGLYEKEGGGIVRARAMNIEVEVKPSLTGVILYQSRILFLLRTLGIIKANTVTQIFARTFRCRAGKGKWRRVPHNG